MVDSISTTVVTKALEHPKELGEGIGEAAKGIGGGVGDAATGIGGGFRESKFGDAKVVEAQGHADAERAKGEAARIAELAKLAEAIKGLPGETQQLILEKAAAPALQQEKPTLSPLMQNMMIGPTIPAIVNMANHAHANLGVTPVKRITHVEHHGKSSEQPSIGAQHTPAA
jgi:hypothetical protein